MNLKKIVKDQWYQTKKGVGKCLYCGNTTLMFEIDGRQVRLMSNEVQHEIAKGQEPQEEQLAEKPDDQYLRLKQLTADGMRQAAQHLAKSSKGRDALQAVLAWLDHSGCSLDETNQAAILTLLEGAWGPFAGTARDEMRDALQS